MTPFDSINPLVKMISEAQAEEPGTINGVKPGPSGPIRPGHPYRYIIKNGKIYDSANVAVSPESLAYDISRLQSTVEKNSKQNARFPQMAEFANSDLLYGIAAIQQVLEEYRKKYGNK